MKAPRYLVELWQGQLEPLFSEPDKQDVLEWLMANHDRKRVVLVGSGFSRNAKNPGRVAIPLWEDISTALAVDLGVSAHTFDPLSLADFHRRTLGPNAFQGKLLGLLDDTAIEPGAAHAAIWRSNPEAVITTNFLDTLLERHPKAQAVKADPDLALSTDAGKAQVIYFHGHRSDFGSWVVGRSDYDDLPYRRPMLFARARQLFAQFPLLVVGYSLTDPDFHLVYRQMVSAMDRRHPMGLAVMLPRDGQDSAQAQRAAKKYWEDLNLRIVQFRAPSERESWEDKFVDFFDLTKRIEHRTDLDKTYRVAARDEDIATTFCANVEVMRSALDDGALSHVWTRSSAAASRFWMDALRNALPEELRQSADRRAQEFNLEHVHRATSDGTNARLHKDQESERRCELREDDWVLLNSDRQRSCFERLWAVFERQRGRPLIWNLTDLLQKGVDRQMLATWLRVAVERPDVLDEPTVDSKVAMCGLLFLTSWDEPQVRLVRERAASRFPDIEGILGPLETSPSVDPPVVALLKQARCEVEMGNSEAAHKIYRKAAEHADACSEPDAPLLSYFALQGCADTTVTPRFLPTEIEQQTHAIERCRAAGEHPLVRRWRDRVERFRHALAKSKAERLEQELVRSGYESSSFSVSSSGWHLYVICQDAVHRGAPLSIERELTMNLLGAFDSGYDELDVRLRLNLDKPGQWLSRQVEIGNIFRPRARSLFADRSPAGASERTEGVKKLGNLLFPPHAGQSALARRAVLDVLTHAAEVLCRDHISVAIAQIAQAREHERIEAIASVSHVCSWDDVKEQVLCGLDGLLLRCFQRSAEKFPWEHWLTCDDFLSDGGETFLEALIDTETMGFPERLSVGWALAVALAVSPEDPRLVGLGGRFASHVLEGDELDETTREQIANFALHSPAVVDNYPAIKSKLAELLECGDTSVIRILAGSSPDSALGQQAKSALEKAAHNGQLETIEDAVFAARFQEEPRVDWNLIRRILKSSWRGLAQLGPILSRDRWSSDDWKELQDLLRLGGHQGKPRSWLVGRLELTIDALNNGTSRRSLFDDSPQGLGFLRGALVEALGSGDSVLANRATYGLAALAEHVRSDAEAEAIAAALLAASDDVRISVAHGAAFVSHYLKGLTEGGGQVSEQIAEAARYVSEKLKGDPLAIVSRQAVFGAAKGKRAAQGQSPGHTGAADVPLVDGGEKKENDDCD